jgi:hypothetical protein
MPTTSVDVTAAINCTAGKNPDLNIQYVLPTFKYLKRTNENFLHAEEQISGKKKPRNNAGLETEKPQPRSSAWHQSRRWRERRSN